MFRKMNRLLGDIYREFGWKTRLAAPAIGLFAYLQLLREERRLARGWRYEPSAFYEKNAAALAVTGRKDALRPALSPGVAVALSGPEPALKP
jgi:hypothetical protein